MEFRDERDLNIYTDGSCYPGPRRGGIGILYVTVDAQGEELTDEYPKPGYAGATINQMELTAAIEALTALVTRRAPVSLEPWRRVVIWTDSMYLAKNFYNAQAVWPGQNWRTAAGNPVANAQLWQELLRQSRRTRKRVEIRWVKGHKKSKHNKTVDKAAKLSAQRATDKRASHVKVRRKLTSRSVEPGSVGMQGQRLTVRIVTDEYLSVPRMNRYKYEVVSKASPFYGRVDWIFSEPEIYLSAGHTYHVRVNNDQKAPRIRKLYREVGK